MSDFALTHQWRDTFMQTVQQHELAARLKTASRQGKRSWTAVMTETIIHTCTALGWQAAAKGYKGISLPVARSEYLSVDVMAFQPGPDKWKFPTAVLEWRNRRPNVGQLLHQGADEICLES
ncbi:MAG: hypothetical protein KJ069_29175 [Anaerolineae bacterium]|nr:hypothetical protein [Anaerolineae bacterium]